MPLIGANPPPNNNAPTPLEKEEKTKEISDNKEKPKKPIAALKAHKTPKLAIRQARIKALPLKRRSSISPNN